MVEHKLTNLIYPSNNPQVRIMWLPASPSQQVQPQTLQTVVGVIMVVWFATYVLQQIILVFKGEAIEKPSLLV